MDDPFIFPLENIDAILAWHNVAGREGVLCAANDAVIKAVGEHYAARASDHIPFTPPASPLPRFILTSQPEAARKQTHYRSRLAGVEMHPLHDPHVLPERGIQRALFLPYIRLTDPPLSSQIEWQRYGLPPALTRRLKNKADLHHWLLQNDFAEHTMNFVACPIEEIPAQGWRMLRAIETMYAELGMSGAYPLGLMVRGAHSDGNYGAASLIQALQDGIYHGETVRRGEIILKKDGTVRPVVVFAGWQEALEAVRDHIHHATATEVEDRVVMTRWLDLSVSPGICAAVVVGEVYPFAFNGQYTEPGDSACTGTSTFQAAVGVERATQIQEAYLEQTQNLLKGILQQSFQNGMPHDALYAMLNLDVMIPGPLENELWQRAHRNPRMKHWIDALGKADAAYQPRVYAPDRVILSEINPRDTNWTLAMKAVLQATQQPCTVGGLEKLANGRSWRVVARDRWRLPPNIDFDEARERLLEFHHRRQAEGEGFILRMADNPAGVILYSPSHDPARLDTISRDAYQMLADKMPVQ